MIDYLTLKRDFAPHELDAIIDYLEDKQHLMQFTPSTGEVEWMHPLRESIRSDSHQVQIHITHHSITVSGSPARSMGQDNNVFGTDCIVESATAHLAVASSLLPFPVGKLKYFKIVRADITYNYDMGGASEVRQALAYLRSFDGGRYRVNTASETIYWQQGSNLRSGKAYHKGEHIRYTNKKGQTDIEDERINLADRLLRLELKLGGKWFSRKRMDFVNTWEYDYKKEHIEYFNNFIGKIEVNEMNLQEKVLAVAPTRGQGLSAFRTWALIKSIGHQLARASMPQSTWYRHTKILKDAGLGWGDFSEGKIVPIRTRELVLDQPVTSWEELRNNG